MRILTTLAVCNIFQKSATFYEEFSLQLYGCIGGLRQSPTRIQYTKRGVTVLWVNFLNLVALELLQ